MRRELHDSADLVRQDVEREQKRQKLREETQRLAERRVEQMAQQTQWAKETKVVCVFPLDLKCVIRII